MLQQENCIETLRGFKQTDAAKYGINKIGIFGSVARKENTESSDLDIVVDIEKPTLTLMYNLRQALSQLFGCKVDVVRMRDSLREPFKKNIERDAIYV